jgi:hypothetical protein
MPHMSNRHNYIVDKIQAKLKELKAKGYPTDLTIRSYIIVQTSLSLTKVRSGYYELILTQADGAKLKTLSHLNLLTGSDLIMLYDQSLRVVHLDLTDLRDDKLDELLN